MVFSTLHHLECSREGTAHDADAVQGTSPVGAPLLARYDLERAAASVTPAEIGTRPPDLWRYHELLPVRDPAHVVTLGEGMTPLLKLPRHGPRLGVPNLLMKDEGLIPTGAFKARGAAVGVSRAAELGVKGIAMPTNGNAGAAWASYAARAGLGALIAMPVDAPVITRRECVVAGAELYLVDGLIGDAGRLIGASVAKRDGYQDTSTLKELGWITGDLPRLVAVQATGCAPIVDAFDAGLDESVAPQDARTVAFGITVPKALGDFLVLDAVRTTDGTAIAVTDEELLAAQRALARDEGTWICPEGAACFAAVHQLRQSGWLAGDEEVVVLNTGTGLIYPDTVPVDVPTLSKDGAIPPGG